MEAFLTVAAFFLTFTVMLPILIVLNGVKLRWFGYWLIRGKGHPDHVAKCLEEMRRK